MSKEVAYNRHCYTGKELAIHLSHTTLWVSYGKPMYVTPRSPLVLFHEVHLSCFMRLELAFTAQRRVLCKHAKLYANEVGDQLNLQMSLELLFEFFYEDSSFVAWILLQMLVISMSAGEVS